MCVGVSEDNKIITTKSKDVCIYVIVNGKIWRNKVCINIREKLIEFFKCIK